VGGFIGLYSLFSPLELRVKDPEICRQHRERECLLGDEENYGCPWMVFPGNLKRNAHCGLCTECLKSCPRDNIALNLRPFGRDLLVAKGRGLDEAYKALIMLACALIYSAVFLGPWGWLKDWANFASLTSFALYAGVFLAINLLALPGLFLLVTALAKWMGQMRGVLLKQLFVDYSYALVPLGLMGWIAFSFSFVFINGSYAISVISDPFGWGWDLFGTWGYPWTPVLLEIVPKLQVATLVCGLIFSIYIAYWIARQRSGDEGGGIRGQIPIAAFLTSVTIAFLRLYLG
jgi:ferredoxin